MVQKSPLKLITILTAGFLGSLLPLYYLSRPIQIKNYQPSLQQVHKSWMKQYNKSGYAIKELARNPTIKARIASMNKNGKYPQDPENPRKYSIDTMILHMERSKSEQAMDDYLEKTIYLKYAKAMDNFILRNRAQLCTMESDRLAEWALSAALYTVRTNLISGSSASNNSKQIKEAFATGIGNPLLSTALTERLYVKYVNLLGKPKLVTNIKSVYGIATHKGSSRHHCWIELNDEFIIETNADVLDQFFDTPFQPRKNYLPMYTKYFNDTIVYYPIVKNYYKQSTKGAERTRRIVTLPAGLKIK